jgi:hypothetical protein
MKKIKFRVWDKESRRMLIVTDLDFKGIYENELVYVCCEGQEYNIKNVELLQFTGIKDKNWKEIYEGDIVKSIYCDGTEIIHEVKFSPIDGYNWEHLDLETIEVMGNKFENPELLI